MQKPLVLVLSLLLFTQLEGAYAANGEKQSCELMLVLSGLETSPSLTNKSKAEKVFSVLPLVARSALARLNSQAREFEIQALKKRIDELLPSEIVANMAAPFQGAMAELPVRTESLKIVEKKTGATIQDFSFAPGSYDFNIALYAAQEAVWGKRLKEAYSLLKELLALQELGPSAPSEIAMSQLKIGILASFCSEFQSYITGGRTPDDLYISDNKGELTWEGLDYLKKALVFFEPILGRNNEGILTLKYLILSQARSGIDAHLNLQWRKQDWARVSPDAVVTKYINVAMEFGRSLEDQLADEEFKTSFTSRHLLFFYVQSELQSIRRSLKTAGEPGSLLYDSPAGREGRAESLALLLRIIAEARKTGSICI